MLIRFETDGSARLGTILEGEVVDLSAQLPALATDISGVLEQGPEALSLLEAARNSPGGRRYPLSQVHYLPPCARPGKVICLGLNYADHTKEANLPQPPYPEVFLRTPSSFVAHEQPLLRPTCSEFLDFEGELVAFVGQRARNVPKEAALTVIAGYSVFNDGSIRDYQMLTSQWTLGKNFDGTGGFGPGFVPANELPPGASGLRLETRLNGEVMQSADTSDMIFSVAEAVALLSRCMTLDPGDMLVMGTPSGIGAARRPRVFMKPGDICEVEIEGIAILHNPIGQA